MARLADLITEEGFMVDISMGYLCRRTTNTQFSSFPTVPCPARALRSYSRGGRHHPDGP
jgi:hypothetical protein